ncbi:DEAD/DEAH box helicase family protein [Streptomyces noursei]|uniref:DEAD/DEAH box helicase family protein n=1 Tax=Streptomyces noursei TaxID=1971 RepID=UPI003DA39CA8
MSAVLPGLAARSGDDWGWLYDHQPEVLEAILKVYTPKPGSRRKRYAAQIHLAPGLGKTRIAFMVGDAVAQQGGMLFVVPQPGSAGADVLGGAGGGSGWAGGGRV